MKILINTPDINALGGVANHYYGLKDYWTEDVRYNTVGRRKVGGLLWLPWDLLKFFFKLIHYNPNIVLLNPSLGHRALRRDFLYLQIAILLRRKVVCFIHGFNLDYAKTADWKWICRNLDKTSCVIVLAQAFKQILREKGVTTDIELSTTKVLDTLIKEFDVSTRTGKVKNILFLSRIEKAKGVYETVDTFEILKSAHKDLTLTIVGDGTELTPLKQYVESKGVQDIYFTGGLSGEALKNEYKKADFFFFTSHGEGMPTVVLEAMAFGLPIMTRAVGGLCDFFEDGKMGRITESMSPIDFANMVEPYLNDGKLVHEVSIYNHNYAKEHFLASKVAVNMENLLKKYM